MQCSSFYYFAIQCFSTYGICMHSMFNAGCCYCTVHTVDARFVVCYYSSWSSSSSSSSSLYTNRNSLQRTSLVASSLGWKWRWWCRGHYLPSRVVVVCIVLAFVHSVGVRVPVRQRHSLCLSVVRCRSRNGSILVLVLGFGLTTPRRKRRP